MLDTHSPGVNVPHLAIDYWRSIFAANYDPLSTQGTSTPRIDPKLGVLEPSVSRFDRRSDAGQPRRRIRRTISTEAEAPPQAAGHRLRRTPATMRPTR